MKRHRAEWSRFEISKEPLGAGPESDIKYGVPYDWGTLQVTEQADSLYGFVPLAEGVVKGDITQLKPTLNASELRTDIYLMSPQELEKRTALRGQSIISPNQIGTYASNFYKDGMEVRIALNQNPHEMKNNFLEGISAIVEQYGTHLEDMRTLDNIPVAEIMGQDVSQVLVHEFCDFTVKAVKETAAECLRTEINKVALRDFTKLGAVGVGSAGVLLGLNGVATGEVHSLAAGSAVAYTGISFLFARNIMKRRLQNANLHERKLAESSSLYGHIIAGDIHTTYCTEHFDAQAEAMFQDE